MFSQFDSSKKIQDPTTNTDTKKIANFRTLSRGIKSDNIKVNLIHKHHSNTTLRNNRDHALSNLVSFGIGMLDPHSSSMRVKKTAYSKKSSQAVDPINRADLDASKDRLFKAIFDHDFNAISSLLSSTMSVNIKDTLDTTPLHYPTEFDNMRATHALLQHGANPNTPDKWNRTPLDIACHRMWNRAEWLNLLISSGGICHYRHEHVSCPQTAERLDLFQCQIDIDSPLKKSNVLGNLIAKILRCLPLKVLLRAFTARLNKRTYQSNDVYRCIHQKVISFLQPVDIPMIYSNTQAIASMFINDCYVNKTLFDKKSYRFLDGHLMIYRSDDIYHTQYIDHPR